MGLVDIEYKYSTKNKRYHINKYNKTLNAYKTWLKQNIPAKVVIQNDNDATAIRKKRTIVRKEIDEIKNTYKAVYSILMGEFDVQKDEIINLLTPVDKNLKQALDDYKASKAVVTEEQSEKKLYTLTYETTDFEKYKKVEEFIKELEGENQ